MGKRITYDKGQVIGKCLFIREGISRGAVRRGIFKCACGNEFEADFAHVKRKATTSCGCFGIEQRRRSVLKHGYCVDYVRSKEYSAWASLKARCFLPHHSSYPDYGGRGITVCKRWVNSFGNFITDMGLAPSKKHSIERRNNNKGYSKKNCYWATKIEQLMNRRNTKLYTYKGKTQHVNAWSKELNISKRTLWGRINNTAWSIEKCFNTPVGSENGTFKKVILLSNRHIFDTLNKAMVYLNVGKRRLNTMLRKEKDIIMYLSEYNSINLKI